MLEIFNNIAGFFEVIWQFFTNFITSLIIALQVLQSSTQLPAILTVFMPGIISSSIIVTATIFVLKFIVGR